MVYCDGDFLYINAWVWLGPRCSCGTYRIDTVNFIAAVLTGNQQMNDQIPLAIVLLVS